MALSFFNENTFTSPTSIDLGVFNTTLTFLPSCDNFALVTIFLSIVIDVSSVLSFTFLSCTVVVVPALLIEADASTGAVKLRTTRTNGIGASERVTHVTSVTSAALTLIAHKGKIITAITKANHILRNNLTPINGHTLQWPVKLSLNIFVFVFIYP